MEIDLLVIKSMWRLQRGQLFLNIPLNQKKRLQKKLDPNNEGRKIEQLKENQTGKTLRDLPVIFDHYILFCFTVTNFYAIVFNELINKYLPLKEMKKRTITVKWIFII